MSIAITTKKTMATTMTMRIAVAIAITVAITMTMTIVTTRTRRRRRLRITTMMPARGPQTGVKERDLMLYKAL